MPCVGPSSSDVDPVEDVWLGGEELAVDALSFSERLSDSDDESPEEPTSTPVSAR
jgi:hypothetical protein